jgi:hypothetical protein
MPSTANAVFILVFAMFGAGMVLLLSSKKLNAGVKNFDPRRKLATLCVCGAVAGLLGIINLVLVHRSNRSSATGVIVNLSQHHGKHDSSSFDVRREDGSLLHVHCDYAGTHLIPRETVHVDVLNYQSTLLNLNVLDGPFAGWTLTEWDGTLGSEVTISCGFIAALTAWVRRRWIGRPEMIPEES